MLSGDFSFGGSHVEQIIGSATDVHFVRTDTRRMVLTALLTSPVTGMLDIIGESKT